MSRIHKSHSDRLIPYTMSLSCTTISSSRLKEMRFLSALILVLVATQIYGQDGFQKEWSLAKEIRGQNSRSLDRLRALGNGRLLTFSNEVGRVAKKSPSEAFSGSFALAMAGIEPTKNVHRMCLVVDEHWERSGGSKDAMNEISHNLYRVFAKSKSIVAFNSLWNLKLDGIWASQRSVFLAECLATSPLIALSSTAIKKDDTLLSLALELADWKRQKRSLNWLHKEANGNSMRAKKAKLIMRAIESAES